MPSLQANNSLLMLKDGRASSEAYGAHKSVEGMCVLKGRARKELHAAVRFAEGEAGTQRNEVGVTETKQ